MPPLSSSIADKALDLSRAIRYFTIYCMKGSDMARKIQDKTSFFSNLVLYYIAIGVIILGYVFLSIGDADSFTSLTLGPIVLVIGYLVAMPAALLSGVNRKNGAEEKPNPPAPEKPGRNP